MARKKLSRKKTKSRSKRYNAPCKRTKYSCSKKGGRKYSKRTKRKKTKRKRRSSKRGG